MSAVEEPTASAPADTSPSEEPSPIDVGVAIVGTGFSGLGTAIRLKQEGVEDFLLLERADEVGGTWHFNTYPGCACDVPSHLYSFSFASNPDWTQTYSPQPEIYAYLRRCADDFGIRRYIRFGHAVTAASWDEEAGRWRIETNRGPISARILIAGMGPLAEPKTPEIRGLDRFEGKVFHSARWDHGYDLTGKRVASIGTGASAIQYVPAIQSQVRQLHVFQRTAPWIMPHTNRGVTGLERRLYRHLPLLQRVVRGGIYTARETLVLGFVKNPRLMGIVERLARRHMRRQIPDPELRRKVTPDYTIGCKRILPSNKWYPALAQPNVELVTDGIEEVRSSSIVGKDGVERPVDAIIFGTGFAVTDMPVAKQVRGRDGHTLDERWRGSPRAHLGTAIPGFPNFFMLLGPNTGLGHSSMVYMVESQIAYVVDALRAMRDREVETLEVRADTVDGYNQAIEGQMEGTVWNTGCASWYLDDTGRNSTLWPDWTWRFRQRTARFEPSEYELTAAGQSERTPVAA
jgi:cation diffusion facilitator CzcD-associated flavoprotein CzcO